MKIDRVAIQGIAGSFHHEVAMANYGHEVELRSCRSFAELCELVRTNQVDEGLMAIENSLVGSILPNYNLIRKNELRIIGESYLRIALHLMSRPGVTVDQLRSVCSHPMALHQSMESIVRLGLVPLERSDTASAALEVKRSDDVTVGAIASKHAADHYELEIMESNLESDRQNFTRFLRLSKGQTAQEGNKASIRIELGHSVGSLHHVLGIFESYYLNLSKIQSVPIVGKPYEYAFHIDVEWLNRDAFVACMKEIRERSFALEIMGEYQKQPVNFN